MKMPLGTLRRTKDQVGPNGLVGGVILQLHATGLESRPTWRPGAPAILLLAT